MFTTRPTSPKGVLTVGISFFVIAVLFSPVAYLWADASDTTSRGIPVWILPPVLGLIAIFFVAQGLVWMRRDRG